MNDGFVPRVTGDSRPDYDVRFWLRERRSLTGAVIRAASRRPAGAARFQTLGVRRRRLESPRPLIFPLVLRSNATVGKQVH